MIYKKFVFNSLFLTSFFMLFVSTINIPIVSDLVANSEKNIYVKLIKFLSFLYINYYLISFFKIKKIYKIIIIIVVFILTEHLLLANYNIDKFEIVCQQDNELGWTWIPNSKKHNIYNGKSFEIKFNSLGLRGDENSLINQIYFSGNSVTQAQQIPEEMTFVYKLKGINGGFDGYDTYMQKKRFLRDLNKLNFTKFVIITNAADIVSKQESKNKIKRTLLANSSIKKNSLFNFLNRIKFLNFLSQTRKENEDIESKTNWYLSKHFNTIPKDIFKEWTNAILDIKNSIKADFIIVLTPPKKGYEKYKELNGQYDLNYKLKSFSIKHNIFFIDILEKVSSFEDDLYLDYIHLNHKGHSKIAFIVNAFF